MPINTTLWYYFIKTVCYCKRCLVIPLWFYFWLFSPSFSVLFKNNWSKQTTLLLYITKYYLYLLLFFFVHFLSVAFYSDVGNFCRVILWWVKVLLYFFISVNRREQWLTSLTLNKAAVCSNASSFSHTHTWILIFLSALPVRSWQVTSVFKIAHNNSIVYHLYWYYYPYISTEFGIYIHTILIFCTEYYWHSTG